MKLTRAQAHRLIELYGYTGPARAGRLSGSPPPRSSCLTRRAATALNSIRISLASRVSWVAQDEIDRIIYG